MADLRLVCDFLNISLMSVPRQESWYGVVTHLEVGPAYTSLIWVCGIGRACQATSSEKMGGGSRNRREGDYADLRDLTSFRSRFSKSRINRSAGSTISV